ncbi:MAG: hypothetical protein U0V74_16450 [Chitinophagales bacterium]
MERRFIATISITLDGRQLRVMVIDQKNARIVYDAVSEIELKDKVINMLTTQYGNEVMFIDNTASAPPESLG